MTDFALKSFRLSKNINACFRDHKFTVILETVRGEEILYPDELDQFIEKLSVLKDTIALNPCEKLALDYLQNLFELKMVLTHLQSCRVLR